MVNIYVALLRADGTEPDPASGYCRIPVGMFDIVSKPAVFGGKQIAFPDVLEPGYGVISAMAVCDNLTGGIILHKWNIPNPQDCHAGVVPVIYNGHLYRGMEVQAKVNLNSADLVGGM